MQHPAARLAGRTPRSSMVPLEPFKNKVFKLRRQGPDKRSLPGRPTKAFRGTCRDAPRVPARPGERQAPRRDKLTTAASFHSVPTLQLIHPRVALGPSQAHVAGGCAARGTWWQAAMTWPPSWRTEAPRRSLFALFGATATGNQCPCPLSSELGIEHYANTVPTTTIFTFLPSTALPPVSDPFDL